MTRTAGSVLLDGAEIRDVDVVSLRSQIAFVADDSFLFSATVAENIAYARPQASREEIERAATAGAGARVHRAAPGWLRDDGRRAGADAVGRAAPADRDRAGARRRPAGADPRRRHLLGRRDDRGADPRWAARGDGRADDLRRRAPALDDRACRRGRGHGRGPDRRPRHAGGAARALRRSSARSPSTGSRTRCSCRRTWKRGRRWRGFEQARERRPERGSRERRRGAEPARAAGRHLAAGPRAVAHRPRRGSARAQAALAGRAAAAVPGPRGLDDHRPDRGDRGRPGAAIPRRAGDRRRDQGWRRDRAFRDRRRLRAVDDPLLGGDLRADLPGRLDRQPGAAGPAPADLRPRPGDVDRLLHAQPARAC